MKGNDDVKSATAKVLPYLKRDPGLIFQMCLKYEKQKDYDILTKLLLVVKNPQERQNKWWNFKARVMRELLKEKDFVNAYKLAIDNNNENTSDYADAEWLAGWIALRFLNNDSLAQNHFNNLYQRVKYPISLSRALYWLGRSYERSKPQEAMQYYKLASQHVETFYGQLAIIKLDEKHIILPKPATPSIEDVKHHHHNILAKISWLFAKINRYEYVKLFNKAAIESVTSPGEMILISEMSDDNLHALVDSTKHTAQKKQLFSHKSYPKLGHIEVTNLETPLVLSIIRQESVFDHFAVSPAGAMGLMQIIPPTAKELSAELSKPLKKNQDFFHDHAYQIDLGSHYLRKLIDKYNGSYILAIAAYNAGSNRVNKWLEEYGDPRNKDLEAVIDWIEIIPFYETRNYIQRVLENLQIYRLVSATTEQDKSLCLVKDLCGIK
jgi:soluble lytic murein transglycosylase